MKTRVTSAIFRLPGNLPLMIASFSSFSKKSDETLWVSFNILEGILILVAAYFWVDIFNFYLNVSFSSCWKGKFVSTGYFALN